MSVDLPQAPSDWKRPTTDEKSDSNLPTPELIEDETQKPSAVPSNSRERRFLFLRLA